jgi:starvation-inducible DNA-binding protein
VKELIRNQISDGNNLCTQGAGVPCQNLIPENVFEQQEPLRPLWCLRIACRAGQNGAASRLNSSKGKKMATSAVSKARDSNAVEGDGSSLDISVEKKSREDIAMALMKATADSYTLYAKTLGVHWNVQGPSFYGLHKLTEAQYEELHQAADAIAERIRALGKLAPTGNKVFRDLTIVDNDAPHKPTTDMIAELVADNEAVARRMSEFAELADEAGDMFTNDLLIARIGVHEKNAWMLRASIHSD